MKIYFLALGISIVFAGVVVAQDGIAVSANQVIIEAAVASVVWKISVAIFALAVLVCALRLFDYFAGIKFREGFDIIEDNALALSVYFGLRFLAACWLIAALFGSV